MAKAGFVYVMATIDDHRKVGVTTTPKRRLHAIQNGCPYPVCLEGMWSHSDPFAVENHIHRALKVHKAGGEWFRADRAVVFNAVLSGLRSVPGGMMDYSDEFDFIAVFLKRETGAPKKLVGDVLEVARAAWDDPTLTADQAVERVLEQTGMNISLKTMWTLGPKALVPQARLGRPKKLTGEALVYARELWGRRDVSSRQVAAEIKAKTGVDVGVRTLLIDLGHKTDAVEKAERTLRRRVVPPPEKQPQRRKAKRKVRKS